MRNFIKTAFVYSFLHIGLISFAEAQDGEGLPDIRYDLIPSAPNSQNIARYGNTQVNYSSGKANISIPITEIRSGDLVFPISLSYQYDGLRVQEEAGWTGLGWHLNPYGTITRSVNGLPDEAPTLTYDNLDASDMDDREVLKKIINKTQDNAPDTYTIILPVYRTTG